MTNYKNKIKIKSLNENSLPLFEGYKEDKITKPPPNLKALKIKSKSENSKAPLPQTGRPIDKVVDKQGTNAKGINKAMKPTASLSSKTPNINNNDSPLSLGIFLQEARVKAGYSLSQIAIITKLNIHYIEALERDDFKNTPPLIYIKAYIKKLSSLYKIDTAKALNLLKSFDNADKKLSNSIFQELQETKQDNTKDEEKIKTILKISAIAFLVIIIIGCISGFLFWLSGSGSDTVDRPLTVSEKAATIKSMEKLIAPQSISLTELPVKLKKQ